MKNNNNKNHQKSYKFNTHVQKKIKKETPSTCTYV